MIEINFKLLHPEAHIPKYQTYGAAGADLVACPVEEHWARYVFNKGERKAVGIGIAIEIPHGYEAQIRSRSGLAREKGLVVLNSPGTIDSDFRGELQVLLFNASSAPQTILRGDRIAQLVLAPVTRAKFNSVEELSPSIRGTGGFGSTGR